jgi:sugar phosphate isomerase/epimerase
MPDPTELSVQLYSVREALAADPDATLARLAAIGFRQVEPFALLDHAASLREGLPRHGLAAPTTHADILTADPEPVFAIAAELGIGRIVQPWLDPARWQTADDVARLADALNAAAEGAAAHGLRVGYHNHHFELESRLDGRHALEVFDDRLASDVRLEVDTYWAMTGGADVPALLARLGDRVFALHLKDGDGSLDPKRQVPLGRGRLPLAAILDAAPGALRVVELDDTEGDRFDALRIGRDHVLDLARG